MEISFGNLFERNFSRKSEPSKIQAGLITRVADTGM